MRSRHLSLRCRGSLVRLRRHQILCRQQLCPMMSYRVCVKYIRSGIFALAAEAEDVIIVPTGKGVIQTDEEEVVRRVACHRRGRSLGNESVSQSISPARRKTLSPPRRIVTRSTVWSTHLVD
ncbi:UNVERIFIED_CONTAM: hypothetical protein Sradi_5220700 [Sesamum radiatum]|uniref:Uncharacterized protein n=1 Tax=Sesamum radiatum TaxID=300843 RepID=A0AAW2LJZ8_SESRA